MDDVNYTRVRIPTQNPFVLTDVTEKQTPATLKAEYYTPATLKPPYPAVVVNEGLGGVKDSRERRYGRFLAQNGFAALVVDSFATRGFDNAPHPIRAINVTECMMLADAFASLSWLSERPEVDASRIFNIGFSYGGMICLLTAYEQVRRTFVKGEERFAGHVSYYGPTVPRLEDYRTTGAPIAIMNGELDQNFDPKRLDLIAGDLKNGGSPVDNIVYENTYHQWDADDQERRFDRFNIQKLATRITPENHTIDERHGTRIRGFTSRLVMIARNVSLAGFHLLRDADVLRQSDETLLRVLATGAPEAMPAEMERAGQARPMHNHARQIA